MIILDWPAQIRPSQQSFKLVSNGAVFTSPFTASSQTVRYPGSRWQTTMSFDNLDDQESRLLEVLLARLDGQAGRVRLFDFGRAPAVQRGTPLVNGAGQSGDSVNTDGWAPNVKVLSYGDYIQVGTELKMVLSDTMSSAAGQATIEIGPMLRYSPADNSAVGVANPVGVFMQSQQENGWDRKPAFANSFSLEFIEAFP